MFKTLILAMLVLSSSVFAEPWGGKKGLFRKNNSNDPMNFNFVSNSPMKFGFHNLKLESKLEDNRFAWSENFWPSNKGGIAYRWNHPNPQPFKYRLLSKEEVRRLSEDQLSQLSPAELYDISQGDFSYSLTKKVLSTYTPDDYWWEGICHGWSQAAANYPEPMAVSVVSKDGIRVPFGSSDVKGLLAMHDAFNSQGSYARVGDRCKSNGKVPGEEQEEDGVVYPISKADASSDECRDTNAGTFHVVIANMIGENQQSFVIDIDRYNDVWNQPVNGYKSEVLEDVPVTRKESEKGISSKIRVKTVMEYGEELEFHTQKNEDKARELNEVWGWVSKLPVTGTDQQMYNTKTYEYVLELNNMGNIIGGEWISETRPDMMWMKRADKKFLDGKFPLSGLNRIYKPIPKR